MRQLTARARKDEIIRLHKELGGMLTQSLKTAILLGGLLTEQKASLPHGQFQSWASENLPFTNRTARRYMRLYDGREQIKTDSVSDLTEAHRLMSPSAETTHISNNSGENEWYTPPSLIESATNVMGNIDVDPASSEIANKTVGADVYYDGEKNGLEQIWKGRVWLNPPYSQPHISQFCKALEEKLSSGEVSEACVLVNNATETAFGQKLLGMCSAVCFPSGRIKFLDAKGVEGAPLQGQMVAYFGEHSDVFMKEFSKFGVCLPMSDVVENEFPIPDLKKTDCADPPISRPLPDVFKYVSGLESGAYDLKRKLQAIAPEMSKLAAHGRLLSRMKVALTALRDQIDETLDYDKPAATAVTKAVACTVL